MPPTLKNLKGNVALVFVCLCACSKKRQQVRVIKFHKQIPHQKIADLYFLLSMNYLPLWSCAPF